MPAEGRVAITGVGVVGPGAADFDRFIDLLDEGESAIGRSELFESNEFRSHAAGVVTDFKPKNYIRPAKLRRLNQLSRFALVSAAMAIENAGLEENSFERGLTGVALGTSFGPVDTSVRYLEEYIEKGPSLAPPQLFAESVANAPGSHVAIEWKLKGFNVTFTQRETSALAAAGYAAMQIVAGNADRALTGGIEELNEVLYSVLDQMGALAKPASEGEEMRPFDARRNGLLPGEGGATLVLEADPGGVPLAWLTGFAAGRDATATLFDWGRDHSAVERVMREAIADAELEINQIDAVWASANGSIRGDELEARAIREVFGSSIPPVVAVKGYFGEYAAGGGLHLAAAVAGVSEQKLWASPGYRDPQEGLELPVTRETAPGHLRHVLVNALAAGGAVGSMILSHQS